jgi:hypothetical protein
VAVSYSEKYGQVKVSPYQKWSRKYFAAGISHEMWEKAVEHAFNAGVEAAIHEVTTGRAINNFGHVPKVRRALEWVMMDLQALKEGEK